MWKPKSLTILIAVLLMISCSRNESASPGSCKDQPKVMEHFCAARAAAFVEECFKGYLASNQNPYFEKQIVEKLKDEYPEALEKQGVPSDCTDFFTNWAIFFCKLGIHEGIDYDLMDKYAKMCIKGEMPPAKTHKNKGSK